MDDRQNSIIAQSSVKAAADIIGAFVAAGKEVSKGDVLKVAEEIEQWVHLADTRWPDSAPKEGEMFRPAANTPPAPDCPDHHIPMDLKTNRSDGSKFWSCPNYKSMNCKQTAKYVPLATADETPPF